MRDYVTKWPTRARSCQNWGCAASEGGNAPVRKMRRDVVFNPNIRSIPMAVSQPSTSSSIVLSDLRMLPLRRWHASLRCLMTVSAAVRVPTTLRRPSRMHSLR